MAAKILEKSGSRTFRVPLAMAIGALLMFLSTKPLLAAQEFQILTEELHPYSYTENGKVTGMSVEIVRAVLKKIKHPDTIKIYSWSRAYNLTLQNKGYILFSTTRLDSREKLFKWVGPLAEDKTVFFAKKGSGVIIKSIEDAKKAGSIGTYKDDIAEIYLKERGFTNLESVLDDTLNVKKLAAGRIQLWPMNELVALYTAREAGLEQQIERVYLLYTNYFYMAFSKDTPDDEIASWQRALDEVKDEGDYDKILNKYGVTR